jgi:PAS domain S-box-containing protein
LERHGYQVTGIAVTGQEALQMAQEVTPDLVLMDINLRGNLDGVDTAQVLKKNSTVAIVFMTAAMDDTTFQRTNLCQPDGYISKPIRTEDLLINVKNGIRKSTAETTLRQSEARFRGLFETSLDGIVSIALDGTIQECNLAFSKIAGHTAENLSGMNIGELLSQECNLLFWEKACDITYVENHTCAVLDREGKKIPVSLKAWLRIGVDSQPIGYWGIFRDLTLQKEIEAQLQRQSEHAQNLAELTAILNKQHDLSEIYQVICDEIRQRVGVDLAVIIQPNPDTKQMEFVPNLECD